jgi:hypothetical protein
MGDPSRSNTVLSQNSRFDRISRLIENASEKNNLQEKNQFYSEQISSYPNRNMNINDCIEQSLRNDKNKDYPVLQSFQTLDINALTQGFQREELNEEGKLVLYITEKQLLQLLNQRAIIVPNKQEILESKFKEKKFSLIDETVGHRFGRKTPIKEVELVVDQENIKRVYSKEINSNDSKSVTYCFKSNDNYKPSSMTYTDNNSNTNKNNNNNYDSLDSFDISMHKGSNLTQLDQSFEKTTSKITPYTKYNRKSGSYFSITDKNPDDYLYAQVNEYVNESMRTSCLYENDLTDKDEAKKMANDEEIQIISHQSTVANEKIDTYDINETYYDDTLNLRKMNNSKMSKGDSVEVFESFDNNKNKYKIAFLDDKSHSQDVNRQSQEMDGTISPNKSSDAFDFRNILKKEANLNELIKKNNNDFRSMEQHLQQHEQYDLFSQNKNGISNLDYGFDNITEVQKVSKYHEYLNDTNGYVSKVESEFKSEFHSAYEDKLANKKMIDNSTKIEDERNLKSKLSIDEFDVTKETSTSKNEEALVLSQLDEFFTKLLESQYQKKTSSPQGKKLSFIDESFDSIESFDIGKLRRDSLTENLVNNEKNEPANPTKPVYGNLYSNDNTENSAKKGPCSVKSTESFSKKSNGKFSYTSTIDPKTIRTNSNFKKQLQSSHSSRDQQKSQNTAEKTSKLESSEAIELDQKTCKELDELLTKLKKTYNKQTKRVDRKNVSLSKDEISKLIKFFSRPFDPNDTLNSNTLSKFSSLNKRPSFMEKDSEIEALKKLDEFVCKTLSRNKEVANKLFSPKQAINSISSIDAIDDLIERSKQILNNWNDNIKNSTAISSKKSTAGNSSTGLNKTRVTINEPIKQKVTFNNKSSNASKPPCVLRKKITYAYIDDYNPTTRIYEVADFNNNTKINTSRYQNARDVLNPKTNVCNNGQFDPQIQNSLGKPTLPHLDKFLSGVQNDIKKNIKKINPSVESTFKFQNKYNPSFPGNKNNAGRVLVESEGYNNYIDG